MWDGSVLNTSLAPLDYVHNDCSVHFVGEGRYYMSIIDDFSKNMSIYIKGKNQRELERLENGVAWLR